MAQTAFAALPVSGGNGHGEGAGVTVMIRSECVELHHGAAPAADGSARLPGRIETVDFFGATVSYMVRTNGALVRVDEPSRRQLAVGEDVTLSIPADQVWVIPEDRAPAGAVTH
jgi:ABC-type Fe3+/spermidine/putrescine transport system ATPase subunit